jgi:hypothetical protein
MRHGPWEWVVGLIRGALINWGIEVGGQLKEFASGII